MDTVLESGTARNLTTAKSLAGLVLDPLEKRFVTYVNDLGAVHTIIVDIDHVVTDAEKLVQWFNHTRAIVTHKAGPEGSATHVTPADVLRAADQAVGVTHPAPEAASEQMTGTTWGGNG